MAVVYQHKRLDNNQVFYIGIGKSEKRVQSRSNRNTYWHNIVNKIGFKGEIIMSDLTWDQAKKLEKYLIDVYGRKDVKSGPLVNMTDGGDGVVGKVVSIDTRRLISRRTKEGMTHLDFTGINNKMFGKIVSPETRAKLSQKSKGRPSPMKGKKNKSVSIKNSKKVIDSSTGMIFDSATDAANYYGVNRYTLIGKLNGCGNNNTTLKYL